MACRANVWGSVAYSLSPCVLVSNDMRLLRTLLWPRYISSSPNILGRIGRVVHWALAFIVAPLAAVVTFVSMQNDELFAAVLAFVAVMLVGRALRYILSAE